MLERMTVKGSHGESSLQRESDSFGFYRTVSQQGTAVRSSPRGPPETNKKKRKKKAKHTYAHNITKIIGNKSTMDAFKQS